MRIVDVGGDGALFDVIYSELFQEAFDFDELVSRDQLRTSLVEGLGVLTAVLGFEGVPVAAAFGEWDPRSRVLLLAYIAVRRQQRSRGLGSLLMGEVADAWQERYRPDLTLAEIEHPLAHPVDPDHGDGFARTRFYSRHGAKALDLPYFQPALRRDAGRVYGMLLIALAPLPEQKAGGFIASGPIRAFLTGYFLACEGTVGTDPAVRRLWRAVDRPGGIQLLSLDDARALGISGAP